jgi:tetratricopeptide (TPR) repeat protein
MFRFEKALETVQKAIEYRPTATFFYNKAACYNKLGDRPTAIESLEVALELDPNHEQTTRKLAELQS